MTNEDILTLARAGFTAQQIAALAHVEAPATQANTPAQIPAPAPASAGVEQILAAVQGLNANVQAALLQNSQQPGSGAPETAEQILASIINPPKFEGGIK